VYKHELHHKVQHHEFERQCQRYVPVLRVCCVRSPTKLPPQLRFHRVALPATINFHGHSVSNTTQVKLHSSMMTTAVHILGGFFYSSITVTVSDYCTFVRSRASQATLAHRVDPEESQTNARHAIEKRFKILMSSSSKRI
jgi:hypothetical protein